jgi:hypothetical protein
MDFNINLEVLYFYKYQNFFVGGCYMWMVSVLP